MNDLSFHIPTIYIYLSWHFVLHKFAAWNQIQSLGWNITILPKHNYRYMKICWIYLSTYFNCTPLIEFLTLEISDMKYTLLRYKTVAGNISKCSLIFNTAWCLLKTNPFKHIFILTFSVRINNKTLKQINFFSFHLKHILPHINQNQSFK